MSRFSLDVQGDLDTDLANLAKAEHLTKADIVRRAIAIYSLLKRHSKGPDGKFRRFVVLDSDNKVAVEIAIP